MDDNIKRMIKDAFELEGLLLLADERGEETTALLIEAIREKTDALAAAASILSIPGVEESSVRTEDNATEVNPPKDDQTPDKLPETEENGMDVDSLIATEIESVEDDSPDSYTHDEPFDLPETAFGTEAEEELPTDSSDDTEEPADSADEPPACDPAAENEEDEHITLDEAYIRNKSKDLHGAFSLNDMFRFRRELFGNNAAEMSDAIELVSAMASYQEAEDYFYNDLGWDSGSEEVEEFMTIIRNHFR